MSVKIEIEKYVGFEQQTGYETKIALSRILENR